MATTPDNTPGYERPRPLRPRADEPQELSFDDDDYARDGRAGDLRSAAEIDREYPLRRERDAGLTAGELPGRNLTADDLAPETLLDEDGARDEFGDDSEQLPADQSLRTVGSEEIGGGTGLDEEELARIERPDVDLDSGGRTNRNDKA